MCGIAGVFFFNAASKIPKKNLMQVKRELKRRGEDGSGYIWKQPNIHLFHSRLSIVDLSSRGGQPMVSGCGRYIISFNGEIYNAHELKRKYLNDFSLKSNSDTEVLLELFALKGMSCVSLLRGIFAVVIYDSLAQKLLLFRDNFGIKPLYLIRRKDGFFFGSSVSAVTSLVGQEKFGLCNAGLLSFFLMGSVYEPFTIFEGLVALEPGKIYSLNASGKLQTYTYFSFNEFIRNIEPADVNDSQCASDLRNTLSIAVERNLIADCDKLLLLSAGFDSALIASNLPRYGQIIKSKTIGYESQQLNHSEISQARIIAQALGLKAPIARFYNDDEIESVFPNFLGLMDQPTIDGFNTYLALKDHQADEIKVALSGLGGDEIFGSYRSSTIVPLLLSLSKFKSLDKMTRFLARYAGMSGKKWHALGFTSSIGAAYIGCRMVNAPELVKNIIGEERFADGWKNLTPIERVDDVAGNENLQLRVSAMEMMFYMKNQLLRDSDWASLACGVELRVPLLDLDFVRSVLSVRKSGIFGKKSFAPLLSDCELVHGALSRAKQGFATPRVSRLLESLLSDGTRKTDALGYLDFQKFILASNSAWSNYPQS